MIAQRIRSGWVELCVDAPEAEEIILVEDSAGDPQMMRKDADGHWKCRLQLPDGVYRFHYCIDGTWKEEYQAIGLPEESFLAW